MRYDHAIVIFPALFALVLLLVGYAANSEARWAAECRAVHGQPVVENGIRACQSRKGQAAMKTADLEGPYLDAAVAMAERLGTVSLKMMPFHVHEALRAVYVDDKGVEQLVPGYSTDWRSGGYIMERERIGPIWSGSGWLWSAMDSVRIAQGPTMLLCAMRAFVASKLGDEVDIPTC
jgi:hypothetical protein